MNQFSQSQVEAGEQKAATSPSHQFMKSTRIVRLLVCIVASLLILLSLCTSVIVVPSAQAASTHTTSNPTLTKGVNGNPWGYSFSGHKLIYSPASRFCSYFACIHNFWNGRGYVVECYDKQFSKSGGIRGACSYHHGVWRALYRL
jgi:hypothetical protein